MFFSNWKIQTGSRNLDPRPVLDVAQLVLQPRFSLPHLTVHQSSMLTSLKRGEITKVPLNSTYRTNFWRI